MLSQISANEDKKTPAQETHDTAKAKAIAETAPKEDKVPPKAEAKNTLDKTAAKIDKAAADNAEANKKLAPPEKPATPLPKPEEKKEEKKSPSAADKPVE